jgi:hypothetical protein
LIAGYTPKTAADVLALPWTLTMKDTSSFNFIGPLMLSFAPLLLLLPWKERDVGVTAAATACFFAVALFFTREIRYLLPGFYLIAFLLGLGLRRAFAADAWAGGVHRFLLWIGLGYHFLWLFAIIQSTYRPAKVWLGEESRLSYMARIHSGLNPWPGRALDPAIAALPKDARIYVLGDEKAFGVPRPFVYSSVHDFTPMVEWANASPDPAAFFAKIREQKLTHVLFNYPEAARLKSYALFPWTERGWENFSAFAAEHLVLAATAKVENVENALLLLKIVDKPGPGDTVVPLGRTFGEILNAPSSQPH